MAPKIFAATPNFNLDANFATIINLILFGSLLVISGIRHLVVGFPFIVNLTPGASALDHVRDHLPRGHCQLRDFLWGAHLAGSGNLREPSQMSPLWFQDESRIDARKVFRSYRDNALHYYLKVSNTTVNDPKE